MYTFKELKELVEDKNIREGSTSARRLLESDTGIIARKTCGNHSEIVVFENGFVLYRVDNNRTVFPIEVCRDYVYHSVSADWQNVYEKLFENEKWYLRLALEGEDRLWENQDNREHRHNVSYDADWKDWFSLAAEESEIEEMGRKLADVELVQELLSMATKNQKTVLLMKYFGEMPQKEIASSLGVSQQAVSDMAAKGIRRIRRKYGKLQRRGREEL